MSKIKQVFKANDDSDHETEGAAKRHNRLLSAKEALHCAGEQVTRCLGASALTADGQPFSMEQSQTYFRVVCEFSLHPMVQSIWIWPHNVHVDSDTRDGKLCVRWWEAGSDRGRNSGYVSIPIGELYADKRNADVALVAALKERIVELQERVAEIEAQS